MGSFEYTALDLDGRGREGVIRAASADDALARLRARKLAPVRVAPATSANGPAESRGTRLTAKELVLVTRQLAALVAATPLEDALRAIANQSDRARVRRVIGATHGGVLEGMRLSAAMARQGRAFPALYRAMVAAGEDSGALPEILERLASLLEGQQQVRGKLVTALVYPAALALTAVMVVIALMAFVVPKVVEQFDSMGRELPLLTRIVIGISDSIAQWGLPFLVALAAAAVACARLLRRPRVRLAVDGWILRLPLLGRLLRDLHAASMARTLSIMVGSGLPIMEGLSITVRTVRNRVLRGATESMVASIREGGSLSQAMRNAAVFPPTLGYMVRSGEDSGRLPQMLERAADYLEREFATFTSVVLSLLEPAIIIVLGVVVAVIVLSILLPILQFNALVAG